MLVYQGSDAKVYRATLEDVTENCPIFFKFFKYSLPYSSAKSWTIRPEWEYLDREQYRMDANHQPNRVVAIESGKFQIFQ